MTTIATVWTGTKYGVEYVEKLARMCARHAPPHRFRVLTDRPADCPGEIVDISMLKLPGWWAKMALFNSVIRGDGRTVYLDLDTVIVGDLTPLTSWDAGPFAICENFTRLAGNKDWPCRYGSCAMAFDESWGFDVWDKFCANSQHIMASNPCGDQQAIEALLPPGVRHLLQREMPPGFFCGYRDFERMDGPPPGCSVLVFGGNHKPDNTVAWVKEAWR